MINFDVTHINGIENIFLSNITVGFAVLTVYARRLLYYFVMFEVVFAGFAWVLYQSQMAERLFFQLIKVGLILFIVQNYPTLIDGFLKSVTIIGDQLAQQNVERYLLNPGYLWQYGYDFALDILKAGAAADGFALPMIMVILGFGILFVIGIFGIQVCIQVVGFYVVAAVSILMMPLAAFSPLRDFFSQSVRGLLQAGIRLFVQMLIVSVAVIAWSGMLGQHFATDMNINAPLGLLFTGLLFVFASAYLPGLAAKVVGTIHWQDTPVVLNNATIPSVSLSGVAGVPSLTHATQQAAALSGSGGFSAAQQFSSQTSIGSVPSPASAAMVTQALRSELVKSGPYSFALKALSSQHKRELDRQRNENIALLKTAFQETIREIQSSKK